MSVCHLPWSMNGSCVKDGWNFVTMGVLTGKSPSEPDSGGSQAIDKCVHLFYVQYSLRHFIVRTPFIFTVHWRYSGRWWIRTVWLILINGCSIWVDGEIWGLVILLISIILWHDCTFSKVGVEHMMTQYWMKIWLLSIFSLNLKLISKLMWAPWSWDHLLSKL
jgi:hypothetical protein